MMKVRESVRFCRVRQFETRNSDRKREMRVQGTASSEATTGHPHQSAE